MAERLVTVATFHDPVAAAMAKNFLHSEGIPAELFDEATIATGWMLAGAIGGIKLQVAPIHVERAEMLLARVQAEQDDAGKDEPPTPTTAIATAETAEELQAEREDREPINKLADRLFRTAVFGLIFWPLQVYVLWLFVQLFREPGKVSRNRRWKPWAALLLNLPVMALAVLALAWLTDRTPAGPDHPIWKRYDYKDLGFDVNFPHAPEVITGKDTNELGEFRYFQISARAHQRRYQVDVIQAGERVRDFPADQLLRDAVRSRAEHRGGKVVREERIELAGIPGRAFLIEYDNRHVRGQAFLAGQDIFMQVVAGSLADVQSDEADRYFKSWRWR
jgi:hypothetical protein